MSEPIEMADYGIAEDTLGHQWLVIDKQFIQVSPDTFILAKWLDGMLRMRVKP